MKKIKPLFFLIAILFATSSYSQNLSIAKAYYSKAKEAFEKNEFNEALEYISKTKDEIKSTNPDIMYLEVMSYFQIDKKNSKIESIGMVFINNANKNDNRIKTISKKIVEHKEALSFAQKEEDDLYKKIKKEKSNSLIKSFIAKYPNSQRNNELKYLANQFELENYNNAKQTKTEESYSLFIKEYPNSDKLAEIKALLEETKELKTYKNVLNSIGSAPNYISNYPNGKYLDEITNKYKEHLLTTGNTKFENKDFQAASEFYTEYKKYYGSDTADTNNMLVDRNLKTIEIEKIKKEKIANRSDAKYIMLTYGSDETYGLQFGKLGLNKIGVYFNIAANKNIFSLGAYEGDEFNSSVNFSELRKEDLENIKHISANAVLGLTYKLNYPVWINVGAGIKYNEYHFNLKIINSEDAVLKINFNDKDDFDFFPELGVSSRLGKLAILNVSGQYIDGQFYYKGGIGIKY